MYNSRIIHFANLNDAKKEIEQIGVDAGSLPWLTPKALYITIKVEGITSFAANVIKQEMLSKGGDVAVNRGVSNCSIEKSNILMMGTLSQYTKLLHKLNMQPGSLKEIAKEVTQLISIYKKDKPDFFDCSKYKLPLGNKTYVMGILNATPDSFSDGGLYNNIEEAVRRAKEMVSQGADIIDIGGESTRPGHEPVSDFDEIRRVVPIIEALSSQINIPISIDTSKAIVANKALQAGACIVNDVWGFQKDDNIAQVVADFNAGCILMHNSLDSQYDDIFSDIIKFLRKSVRIAQKAGVNRESIMIDPGIGFGKTLTQNLLVMRRIKDFSSLGLPVLLGTSRKSIIGKVLDLPIDERLEGTAATLALGITAGVDVVRVHDVVEMKRVVVMSDAIVRENFENEESSYLPLLPNWKSKNNVYLALGSNMGDSETYLKEAITFISQLDGTIVTGISNIYETIPVGFIDQGNFLNMALRIETTLTSIELLNKLQTIEQTLKRERIQHCGPRTIDIDILLYKDISFTSDSLTLPHPRMFQRAFVLVPLSDVYNVTQEALKESHISKASILKLASKCEDFHGVKHFKPIKDWNFNTLTNNSSNIIDCKSLIKCDDPNMDTCDSILKHDSPNTIDIYSLFQDDAPNIINCESLFINNAPKIIGQQVILIKETPSTNDYAREIALTNAKEGTAILSLRQSMGRGRMGRTWQSQNDDGIWLSVILKPNFDSNMIPMITLLFAVSIVEVIFEITNLKPQIKWPNDIIINNKKVCGILCESNFTGNVCNFIVAGIGINVNQESFCENLKAIATSLRISTNNISQKDEILKRLFQIADKYYADFVSGDFEKIIDIYRNYSSTIGSEIEILRNNIVIKCKALDISKYGNLIVSYDDESIEEISSGEIFVKN